MKNEINDLVNYKNIKIVQNAEFFKFSIDSILLPNFVELLPTTKNIIDLGTGNAPIPLILSTKTKASIYAVEIQEQIFKLAEESIKMNELENNIKLIKDDINNMPKKFGTDKFDLVTCNPPYFKVTERSIKNENEIKANARHEKLISLEEVIKVSSIILKNKGSLCLIHRTDRLIEIINLMQKYNIEPKRIRLVYPKKDFESNIVMIDGRKNGKSGLKILYPLIAHNSDGSYTKEIIDMFS